MGDQPRAQRPARGLHRAFGDRRAIGEPGEPEAEGSPAESTRWYRFTAPTAGALRLSTAAANHAHRLTVWKQGPYSLQLVEVVESGEDGAFLTAAVDVGATYEVSVGGRGGRRAPLALQWAFRPPANDAFAEALVIDTASPDVTVYADNTRATSEPTEPLHAGASSRTSVWFAWKAPSTDTVVTFDTAGSTADTALAVYTGSLQSGLHLVAENDAGPRTTAAKVSFLATAHRHYRIAVTSQGAGLYGGPPLTGAITLRRLLLP